MMTPTHLLLSCGLLTARNSPARNLAVIAGGAAPDLPMLGLFIWDRYVQGLDEGTIWEERYWTDAWQIPTAIGHSIPIALVILAVGMAMRWQAMMFFAGSVLVHVAGDLPFHNDDAHMHLWPLSRYKFISPISYWDPAHYGTIMHWVELALMVAMLVVLWRRFEAVWVRTLCICGIGLSIAVPVYFMLRHTFG